MACKDLNQNVHVWNEEINSEMFISYFTTEVFLSFKILTEG